MSRFDLLMVSQRRRNEGGYTLMELMVAMAVGAIVVLPLSTFFISSIRQQGELFNNNQDIFSQGLVSRYFPADVASATQVWTPGTAPLNASAPEATGNDCAGTDPASGGGGTIVATFVTSGDQSVALPGPAIRTTYTERTGTTGALVLYRRQCPNASVNPANTTASVLSSGLGLPTSIKCAATAGCPQVIITVHGRFKNQLVTTSATRRTDTALPATAADLPPSAVITAIPSAGYRPLVVRFSADSSTDPSHSALDYAWDFGDGNGGSGVAIDHTYVLVSGASASYTANLTVTNAGGATSTASVVITVNRNPPVPTIVSASATTPSRNQKINFVSNVTTDDGNTAGMSYLWDFGPNAVVPPGQSVTANPQNISWTKINAQQHVKVSVTDAYGLTGQSNEYSLQIVNGAPKPIISAPANNAVLTRGVAVSFASVGSSDPDGTISSYAWSFGDLGTATGASATHTYLFAGAYTVTLTATDNDGGVGATTIKVIVSAAPPTVSVAASAPGVFRGLPSTFVATATKVGGTIVSYTWDFDGFIPTVTTTSNESPPVTYPDLNQRRVTVTVTDNDGMTAVDSKFFTPLNRPPTVMLTRTPPTGTAPFVMQFDSTGTVDPDNAGPLTFLWSYQNKNGSVFATSTLPIDSRTISPGNYLVTLTATDAELGVASKTDAFTVSGQLPTPTNLRKTGASTFSWDPVWGADRYEVSINYWACGLYSGTITVAQPGTSGMLGSPWCAFPQYAIVSVRAVPAITDPGITPSAYTSVNFP